jgi:photosystem II stability/assembly factor-like uncharacterized protein
MTRRRSAPPVLHALIRRAILTLLLGTVPGAAAGQGGGWQVQSLPALPAGSSYSIKAVSAIDADHVWVAGSIAPGTDGFVASSADGGATWTVVHRSPAIGGVGRLKMIGTQVGVLGGANLFRWTTDGGVTWYQEQRPNNPPPGSHNVGPSGHVYGIAVVDSEHVWTAGYDGASAGVIFHRVPERAPGTNTNYPWWLEWARTATGMYGMSAVNGQTAWAVGYAGNIWKTVDGAAWGQQTSGTGATLNDVAAVDASTAWVVGDGSTIRKCTDGSTWIAQSPPVSGTFRRIAAVDGNRAWVVGNQGVILATTDGGATWIAQRSGTSRTLLGVVAVSATTAWAAGEGVILKTTDGGTGAWAAPTVTGVAPSVGGQTLQTPVTITGTGFREPVSVTAGGAEVSDVVYVSATTVTATLGWTAAPGAVDIVVTIGDGQTATLPNGFTFTPPPVVERITPTRGPTSGGTVVTITGREFKDTSVAGFWTSPVTPMTTTFTSATTLTAVVPATRADGSPWTEGTEYLFVLNPDGQYASEDAPFDFYPSVLTFTDDPLVAGVTPVRQVHITELRQCIDSLRARHSLPAFAWTDSPLVAGDTPVKALHLQEQRTALSAVYAAAGRTPPTWAEPITEGAAIKAAHVSELRAAVLAIW